MSERTYYEQGHWLVTSERLSTKYKDYAMSEIRAVELSRLPLATMAGAAVVVGTITAAMSSLLFSHEIVAVGLANTVGLAAAWQCTWITVKGDAWRGESKPIFATWARAKAVRAAINQALVERSRQQVAS